jgi:hypothetical protein
VEEVEVVKARSYDIKKDVKDCLITATMGQLIKDNPLYRRQLKEMLVGRMLGPGSALPFRLALLLAYFQYFSGSRVQAIVMLA